MKATRLVATLALVLVASCSSDPETMHASRTSVPAPAPVSPAVVAEGALVLPAWLDAAPPDEALDDAKREEIQQESRRLARTLPAGSAIREAFFAKLTVLAPCGRAERSARAGAYSADAVTPVELVRVLRDTSAPCRASTLEAIGFAAHADEALAANVLGAATGSGADDVRRAAWLAFGSLGETAKREQNAVLGASIDRTVAEKLAAARGDDETFALLVAGNAGCAPCEATMKARAKDKSLEKRRIAVAALRFVDSPTSVDVMCASLVKDDDTATRDAAAWALGFRASRGDTRTACLTKAAQDDVSPRVRDQAIRSLATLADDVPSASTALSIVATDGPSAELARAELRVRGEHDPASNVVVPSER